jgi:predicted phosphohydrolase
MIIDCISDLHGHYPELGGGALLIVAGDLTARDRPDEYIEFGLWLAKQKYEKKIVIAGNHDTMLQKTPEILREIDPSRPCLPWVYLCDFATEFEGLKIWGSPWTKRFEGMNPHCIAFTVDTDEELADKWVMIPEDTDILITHCPPFMVLDKIANGSQVGSASLMARFVSGKFKPRLWVFGHIHEGYGQAKMNWSDTILVNSCHVNENYQPVNKPIRIEL